MFYVTAIGRNNLLLLTRLVIRGLLENCMQLKCRMLNTEHQQLQDFFVMVEKVLRHGFKGSSVGLFCLVDYPVMSSGIFSASRNIISLKTPEQELWSMIDKIGKLSKEIEESVTCIEQLPNIQ